MPSIRKLYKYTQERYRSRSRSRSRSPSPSSDHDPSTMSAEHCRTCQLGLFCYDHVNAPRTSNQHTNSQTKPLSAPNDTAKSSQGSTPPSSTGAFEKSQPNEQPKFKSALSNSQSSQGDRERERDPKLPRIQVNGVDIPYWITSR